MKKNFPSQPFGVIRFKYSRHAVVKYNIRLMGALNGKNHIEIESIEPFQMTGSINLSIFQLFPVSTDILAAKYQENSALS